MMEPASRRLRRSDRLRDSRDYRRLSRQGQRRSSREFVLLAAPMISRSGTGHQPGGQDMDAEGRAFGHLGITASRRVGNAVTRNRIKRAVREWYRRSRGMVPPGLDLVVIARRPAAALRGPEVAAALDALVMERPFKMAGGRR